MKKFGRAPSRLVSFVGSAAIAGAVLAAASSAGATIVGSYVVNADSTVTYSYSLDNGQGAFDVAAWSLEFDFLTPDWNPLDVFSGGDVAVPDPGWTAGAGIPVSGQSAQDFLSLDPASDVLIGATLSGFSFTSSLLPGTVVYREFSALGDSVAGTTVGPSPVPEPQWLGAIASLALLALGARRSR